MTFKKNGYEVVKNVISEQLLYNLKIQFNMMKDISFFISKKTDKYSFGDSQSKNSFSVYSPLFFESLSLQLNNIVSDTVGLELIPSYTYARIYYKGATLNPHVDRPSCQYSATICIDSDCDWNFYIKDRNQIENAVKLNPGDMCVYSGCDLIHWRHAYNGNEHMQCFLHYVDSHGKYKDFKYDKRPMMGLYTEVPKNLGTENNQIFQRY